MSLNSPVWDLQPLWLVFGSVPVGVAVAVILGFLIGYVGSMFGIGGGFLVTPFFHTALKVPANLAVASSMGQIPFLSAAGVVRFARAGHIRYRYALWLLAGSLPSAWAMSAWIGHIGASSWGRQPVWQGHSLADLVLMSCYGGLIGVLGLYNLFRAVGFRGVHKPRRQLPERLHAPAALAMGILFGTFAALLGIGGGFFSFPFFVYLCGMAPVEAVATSMFAILITSSLATLNYVWAGEIHFGISLLIGIGGLLGGSIGAARAVRTDADTLVFWLGMLQIGAVGLYLLTRLLR